MWIILLSSCNAKYSELPNKAQSLKYQRHSKATKRQESNYTFTSAQSNTKLIQWVKVLCSYRLFMIICEDNVDGVLLFHDAISKAEIIQC